MEGESVFSHIPPPGLTPPQHLGLETIISVQEDEVRDDLEVNETDEIEVENDAKELEWVKKELLGPALYSSRLDTILSLRDDEDAAESEEDKEGGAKEGESVPEQLPEERRRRMRGRLVRQVATTEQELPEILGLGQVIYSERIAVGPSAPHTPCQRPPPRRQRTVESCPVVGSAGPSRSSSRQLVKQPSAASSSSFAFLQLSSPGPPKMTLVRGVSCSLVDIPTYLSSSVELASLTEAPTPPPLPPSPPPALPTPTSSYLQQSKENIRRLRMEIVRSREEKITPKKTQWTLICIALAFLTACVTIVGTMLSYTSDYQDRAVARQLASNNISCLPSHQLEEAS